ncbi:MAG: hypothetical protein MK081_06025 [Flavobacteriales bacterium]|nr:hypothetical protein [Flavobacteriales bacterium]
MSIPTFTFGKIPVQFWEFLMIIFIMIIISVAGSYRVRKNVKFDPSWRYFLPGMWFKVGGGIFFGLIYTLYYNGGDTTSYYECALAFVNLFYHSPLNFFEALFGGGTSEIKSLFTQETGSPLGYMFFDEKTRTVFKLCIPFVFLGAKSYFVSTVLLALATYGGLWRLYRMFVSYFPHMYKNLAYAVLFMPSVIFWGSGILKDSFTLAATCYFIVATNALINRHQRKWLHWFTVLVAGAVIISIKPYILIILLPGTFVWFFYDRIKLIKNAYFRYIMVPFIYVIILGGSYAMLVVLGDSLGKFAPERALQTAVVIQNDLKQDYYDGASFDIGTLEATPLSIASKFPFAVSAGLYRPFLWESRNAVMLLSGLENLFILFFTLAVLFRMKFKQLRELIKQYPVILYSFVFAILFAFMIGVTTSNFGALVRFKIPLIPLYMASIMIMHGHLKGVKIRNERRRFKIMR